MTEGEAVDCEAFDAEAVLLALGTRFEWRAIEDTDPDFVTGGFEQDGNECYMVYLDPDENQWEACAWHPDHEHCPHKYDHTAAKAACERHYATGKWD